ncbi:hypothetical protein KP509_06G016300 [Ceratopteris richardii]|uniref:Secreted protein n=1 Tax=Ceratopteris richardii TaxID=49495 RepID=A0A8T2UDS5_CERRI|nr:hypothetical protein KP509_06G016300 [Ceratopteris richardii]
MFKDAKSLHFMLYLASISCSFCRLEVDMIPSKDHCATCYAVGVATEDKKCANLSPFALTGVQRHQCLCSSMICFCNTYDSVPSNELFTSA